MKKANFIICLAFAVLSVTIANAQPRYGITAGYSLNNEVLKARNASPEISGGINHGFYVGGQFEYRFGELFSLQTGLQFRRYGTTIRGDVNKVLDNINSTVKGLHAFSPEVVIERKGWDPEHLTDEQKEELDDPLRLGRVPLKNVRASYSLYAIYLPLTAKLGVGNKVSLLAGVNFNYTVIADIKFSARMKDGTVIDQGAE